MSEYVITEKSSLTNIANSIREAQGGAALYSIDEMPAAISTLSTTKYLSPEQYGAAGDGTGDDSDAVQACINAAIEQGLPVFGFGIYNLKKSVNISCQAQTFYFHKLQMPYSKTKIADYVLKLNGQNNTLRVDYLYCYSTTGASAFRLEATTGSYCFSNDISFGTCSANVNAVEYISTGTGWIYYNRLTCPFMWSATGNILNLIAENTGCLNENSFYGKRVGCPGWGIYAVNSSHSNRVYEMCFEDSVDNVCYGVISLINCRITECLNNATTEGYGALFKVVGEYPEVQLFNTYCDYVSVDVSEAKTVEQCKEHLIELLNNGKAKGEAFYLSFPVFDTQIVPLVGNVDRYCVYNHFSNPNTSFPWVKGKLYVYFNHKAFVPDGVWKTTVTTEEYYPIITDKKIPNVFEITCDTSIYLDDNYGAIGINEIRLENPDGYDVIIYDKDGNTQIYDYCEAGITVLHCELEPVSITVETQYGSITYNEGSCIGIYFGDNHSWWGEKIETTKTHRPEA